MTAGAKVWDGSHWVPAVGTLPADPIPTGSVAHWKAEDLLLTMRDGAGVPGWMDRLSGNVVAQPAPSARPLLAVDGIGGRPALVFDGSNDVLVQTNPAPVSTATTGSVLAVVDYTVTGSQWFWSTGDDGSSVRYMGGASDGTTQLRVQSNNNTPGGADVVYATPPTGPTIIEWTSGGGAWTIRFNNTPQSLTVASGSNNGRWFGGVANRDRFALGALVFNNTTNQFFNGRMSELLVVDGAMSAEERSDLYGLWGDRYGIAVA